MARKFEEHMIRSLGARKCKHKNRTVSWIEGGGVQMECPDCNLLACADLTTAVRLEWVRVDEL